jgi:succinate dehydrogenase / fumarate reductase membrane anchor subunit
VAAGVLVLVLLGLHMVIMHLTRTVGIGNPAGGHAVDWGNVVARGKSLVFTLTYILLLGAALFHGLYGFRNIVCELGPSAGLKKAINALLLVGGLGLFGLGTWAAIASFQLARSL